MGRFPDLPISLRLFAYDGSLDGCDDGASEGWDDGGAEGIMVGIAEGSWDGWLVGEDVVGIPDPSYPRMAELSSLRFFVLVRTRRKSSQASS